MLSHPFTAVITSYAEADLLPDAIKKLYIACQKCRAQYEIIIMAGDGDTYNAAKKTADTINSDKSLAQPNQHIRVINDGGHGKPNALNLAVQNAKYDWLIFTDGDVYGDQNSIANLFTELTPDTTAVSGHPISLEKRSTMFGYFSHLFCEAANIKRQSNEFIPMSGYLFLTKKLTGLFPIPTELRADDAYISYWLHQNKHKTNYAKNALVYVRFPKNLNDWLKQKTRSLGGNIQLQKFTADLPQIRGGNQNRNILQDIKMVFFPLQFAKSLKELYFSLCLYPIRLYLWILIYINHSFKKYKTGRWEMILSSKK